MAVFHAVLKVHKQLFSQNELCSNKHFNDAILFSPSMVADSSVVFPFTIIGAVLHCIICYQSISGMHVKVSLMLFIPVGC